MRYYGFVLNTSAEEIKENCTIRWKDFDYDSPIGAMNKYLYRELKSGLTFLAYGVAENDTVYSMFSYDESKYTLEDAYHNILDMLSDAFHVRKVKVEPYEITSGCFYDYWLEAKRRALMHHSRFYELANLRVYEDLDRNGDSTHRFILNEKIISGEVSDKIGMYDESVIKELSNIKAHCNKDEVKGNMVHYIISAKSREASDDIAETLMNHLYEAKRISTKRMVMINEIEPEVYKHAVYFEEVIENNRGGAIVLDLSEKFGRNTVEYGMTCKYIEKMVKKYRNECLFIFTYNMDKPGFAYTLLPQLKKYVIPVMLREGTGDRKAAVNYMKSLIKTSEYSKYANQAGKFMTRFPGDEFSQTDVLMDYEQFESWCINKNILKAYDFEFSDDFMLDRSESEEAPYEKLKSMIGLKKVKEQIDSIIAANVIEKERKKLSGKSYKPGTMHMIFAGNPGSAKTTVAKLFAGIAKDHGILKSGAFVECSGVHLDSMSLKESFIAAKGGVLFIDEAYAMWMEGPITTLLQEMENHRDEVIVVLAGYNDSMRAFLGCNEGLKSRIPYWIDFPDYDGKELTEIFKLMLKDGGFTASEDAINEAYYILDKARYVDGFGNGRYVRNLMESTIKNQSVRLMKIKESGKKISREEYFNLIAEDVASTEEGFTERREPGTALKELEDMIGLTSVKEVMKKAVASFKLKKRCMEKGIQKDKATMHMVFTGNPGTAKTTVARLLAEIMKDENILPSGKFVEAGRADLVGAFVGTTAIKVKKKFREAQGGVLFIDEAYSLCDGNRGSYGDEAINTIVQEMENHREDTVVIFAGYPKEMQEFLERNPGMSSRIAFHIGFEDYSTEELCDITKLMVSKKKMTITDAAMAKLAKIYREVRGNEGYGNGRFVRKMLEEAEMNLAERLYDLNEAEITEEIVSTIEECDIPDYKAGAQEKKKPVGFVIV